MALASGTKLGPYEILSLLGAGGMGEVWRARDPRLGREVAVKVLPEEFFESEERKRRFEREARLLAALNHPGIAAIYSFEEIPDSSPRHILVMELLEGETLRERLRAGPLPVRKAVDVAVQMAKALAAAHEKGIVHRDLKPENVFLTKDDRVKILDFGLAKLARREEVAEAETVSALTEAGAVFGTVGYMSPEQVRGEPVDRRSDIFSFGTIVYEAVSGANPFRRETAPETLTAILKDEPAALAAKSIAVLPALSVVVGRCLEKKSDDRFQSSADLAFALGGQIPVGSVIPDGASTRSRALAMGAITLAALSLGLLALRASRPAPTPVYQRLTFGRGFIPSARFSPDGRTVVYGAAWDGNPVRLFSTRAGALEARSLGLDSDVLCISRRDEMGLLLRFSVTHPLMRTGTLARAPLAGGAPREVLEGVRFADWSPDGGELAVAREVAGKNHLEFPIGRTLLETHSVIACPRVAPGGDSVAFIEQPTFSGVQGRVSLVSLKGTVRVLTDEWRNVAGLAWSPGGDEIWFTGSKGPGGRSLYSVSLSGHVRQVATGAGDLMLHDITREGRVLLAQETSRHGVVVRHREDVKERDCSWLDGSVGTDLSRDGELLVGQEVSSASASSTSVYIRKSDGSSAVRLGDGAGGKLSPDGKWVVGVQFPGPDLVLLPTGPGTPRTLARSKIERYLSVNWMPDGKRIVFSGSLPGQAPRVYLRDLEHEDAHPITPEGFFTAGDPVSPDGTKIVALGPALAAFLVPTDGGEPRPFAGLMPGEIPIRWRDAQHLFVGGIVIGNGALKTYVVEPSTGQREVWKEIVAPDSAGLLGAGPLVLAPDGSTYAYSFHRFFSELYVVEGLR